MFFKSIVFWKNKKLEIECSNQNCSAFKELTSDRFSVMTGMTLESKCMADTLCYPFPRIPCTIPSSFEISPDLHLYYIGTINSILT